jgi:hypothetical protein
MKNIIGLELHTPYSGWQYYTEDHPLYESASDDKRAISISADDDTKEYTVVTIDRAITVWNWPNLAGHKTYFSEW